jgi:hypothetical protein
VNHSWQDVVLALIAAIPSTIAAISSVMNGKQLTENRRHIEVLNGTAKRIESANQKNHAARQKRSDYRE